MPGIPISAFLTLLRPSEIMNIHEFDANNATEEVLLGLNRIVASVEAEARPDDEPVPFEYRVARWQAPSPEHQLSRRFYAEEGGEIVGYLNNLRLTIDDPGILSCSNMVSP